MAAGDHDATVRFKMNRRVIEHRSWDRADIQHMRTGAKQSREQSVVNTRAAKPAIAPEANGAAAVTDQVRR